MDEVLEQTLAGYEPSQTTIDLVTKTDILLLVGPTGAGKDALKQALLKEKGYHHLISHTTRPKRINEGVLERDGKEYHFIDEDTARLLLKERAFVEAKVYSGNLYGTSVAEIQKAHMAHKVAVTDLEVQGVAEYKSIDPSIMAVFLVPPNFSIWQERLKHRYGNVVDAKDMHRRMQTALQEIDQLLTTDYYYAVINDDLKMAVEEVHTITRTHTHDPVLEKQARKVAMKLAEDIRKSLNRY